MTGTRVHLPQELAADYRAEPVQEVTAAEPTVAGVLAALNERLPGVARHILDVDGSIRPHLNIFVGGREARSGEGTATPVADGQEVWVIRAVSGGAGGRPTVPDRRRPAVVTQTWIRRLRRPRPARRF